MAEGDTGINALLGAGATILLSAFVPFAPVLGGAIAGYLQGGSRSDGLRVGTISGLIALIPGLLFAFLFFGLFGMFALGGMGGMPMGFPALGGVFLLFVLVFGAVYLVGLSALGGWIGNYVKYDTDIDF